MVYQIILSACLLVLFSCSSISESDVKGKKEEENKQAGKVVNKRPPEDRNKETVIEVRMEEVMPQYFFFPDSSITVVGDVVVLPKFEPWATKEDFKNNLFASFDEFRHFARKNAITGTVLVYYDRFRKHLCWTAKFQDGFLEGDLIAKTFEGEIKVHRVFEKGQYQKSIQDIGNVFWAYDSLTGNLTISDYSPNDTAIIISGFLGGNHKEFYTLTNNGRATDTLKVNGQPFSGGFCLFFDHIGFDPMPFHQSHYENGLIDGRSVTHWGFSDVHTVHFYDNGELVEEYDLSIDNERTARNFMRFKPLGISRDSVATFFDK